MPALRQILATGDALVCVPLSLVSSTRDIVCRQDGIVIVYPNGSTIEEISKLIDAAKDYQVAASG